MLVLVFQVGEMKSEEVLPDIAWYNVPQPGEPVEIRRGEL